MIYDNIDFHNVEALTQVDGQAGLRIQRVPEEVREKMSENGQEMLLSPIANVELRFVVESDDIEIRLSKVGDESLKMFVFWGDFQEADFHEITSDVQSFKLSINERLKQLKEKYYGQSNYHPRMIRLMFGGSPNVQLYYHGIGPGNHRLPEVKESPSKTLLSYGTSITHGVIISGPHLSYPSMTARKLGMDLLNFGMSGTAYCEPEMADYIASRDDWDIATLALSVNMFNEMFTLEQFKERIEYMVNTVAKN